MKSMLTSLFIMLISFNSNTSMFSQDLRMSVSGIYKDNSKVTRDDQPLHFVDITCLESKYLIFKGNKRNVTLKIIIRGNDEVVFQKKINIKGKYILPVSSIHQDFILDLQYSISIEDSKGQNIYRCNIEYGDCEG